MKKLSVILCLALLLSLMMPLAALADRGAYANGDRDAFEPVGTIGVQWDPDVANKIDLTDGNLFDWQDAVYSYKHISPDNMISWQNHKYVGSEVKPNGSVVYTYENTVGEKANSVSLGAGEPDSQMPENWNMLTYFVADKDHLYIGLYVIDDDVVASDGHYSSGDAVQIQIDFGGKLQEITETDPERVENMENTQGVFYSFCYAGDGQPIRVFRDCSVDNRELNEADGIKGTTAKTDIGWSAELRIAWQTLYEDYEWKAWADDGAPIYVGGIEALPLKSGMSLYYLNHTNANGDPAKVVWAAGTHSGQLDENGIPLVTFDAYDSGISLELPAQDGLEFTCEKIVVFPSDMSLDDYLNPAPETDPWYEYETTLPDTDPWYWPDTDPDIEVETHPDYDHESDVPENDSWYWPETEPETEGSQEFLIAYVANGGTGAPSYDRAKADSIYVLSEKIPTRDGYNFLGWSLDPADTTRLYVPGYPLYVGSYAEEVLLLYAMWEEVDSAESEPWYWPETETDTDILEDDSWCGLETEPDVTNPAETKKPSKVDREDQDEIDDEDEEQDEDDKKDKDTPSGVITNLGCTGSLCGLATFPALVLGAVALRHKRRDE